MLKARASVLQTDGEAILWNIATIDLMSDEGQIERQCLSSDLHLIVHSLLSALHVELHKILDADQKYLVNQHTKRFAMETTFRSWVTSDLCFLYVC